MYFTYEQYDSGVMSTATEDKWIDADLNSTKMTVQNRITDILDLFINIPCFLKQTALLILWLYTKDITTLSASITKETACCI